MNCGRSDISGRPFFNGPAHKGQPQVGAVTMIGLKGIRQFRADTGGNVIMLMAFIAPAILALAGVAIDAQYTLRQKVKVQHALDSAILAGALAKRGGATDEAVIADIRNYVDALLVEAGGGLDCDPVSVVFSSGTDIEGSISCAQPTHLSYLIGQEEMQFGVDSTSTYSVGNVDIAFVFDVSGSMNSENRLPLLKTAAQDAFDVLLPDDKEPDGSVRLAIATYNNSVNAGPYLDQVTGGLVVGADVTNAVAEQIQTLNFNSRMLDLATGERFFYYQEQGACVRWGRRGCREYEWNTRRRLYNDVNVETQCVFERIGPQAATDAPPSEVAPVIAGNVVWDFDDRNRDKERGYSQAISNSPSSSGALSTSYQSCQASVPIPLTDDKELLNAHVSSLVAGGGTAGHIGLAWGWYLISPNWSSIWPEESEPRAYDDETSIRAVILMTDGDFNSTHPLALTGSFQQAQALCDEMKATDPNMMIYTVGFQVPDTVQTTGSGETILEYCATDAAHTFDAANGEQLRQAYQEIARDIADLHLKQ